MIVWAIVQTILHLVSLFVPGAMLWKLAVNSQRQKGRSDLGGFPVAESFFLSLFVLVACSVVIGLCRFPILTQFFHTYYMLSNLCLIWTIWAWARRTRRTATIKLASKDRVVWYALIGSILLFILLLVLLYPKMNWDGFNYYLKHAAVMLKSNTIPYHYPANIYPITTPFVPVSLVTSVIYAYLMSGINLFSTAADVFELADLSNMLLGSLSLVCLGVTISILRRYAISVFGRSNFGTYAVLLMLGTPLLLQYFATSTLYSDMLFATLTLGVVHFATEWMEDRQLTTQNWVWVMAFTLLVLTKVTGIYVGFLALGATASNHLPRRKARAMLLLILGGILTAGFISLYVASPDNRSALLEPKTIVIILIAVLVLLFYLVKAGTLHEGGRRWRMRLSPRLLIMLLFCSLLLVGFFARTFMITGSPFGSYLQLDRNGASNWAEDVFNRAGLGQPSRRPGLPDAYPFIFLVGFQFYPHLALLALFSLVLASYRGPPKLRVNNLMGLLIFLSWMLVFGMRSGRHLVFIIPFATVTYLDSLRRVADRYGTSGGEKLLGVLVAASLAAGIPFLSVAITELTEYKWNMNPFLNNVWNWFSPLNTTDVLIYSTVAGLALVAGASAYRHVLDNRGAGNDLRASLLSAALLGVFLVGIYLPNVIYLCKQESIGASKQEAYERYDSGHLVALNDLNQSSQSSADRDTILCFYDWGTEYFTGFRFRYIRVDSSLHFEALRELWTSEDPADQRSILESCNITHLIMPDISTAKGQRWAALGLAASSHFMLHGLHFLFEEIPPATTLPDGWRALKLSPGKYHAEVRCMDLGTISTSHTVDNLYVGQAGDGIVTISPQELAIESTPAGVGYARIVLFEGTEESGFLEVRLSFATTEKTERLFIKVTEGTSSLITLEINSKTYQLGYSTYRLTGDLEPSSHNDLFLRFSWTFSEANLEVVLNETTRYYQEPRRVPTALYLGDTSSRTGAGDLSIRDLHVHVESIVEEDASCPATATER